MESRYHCVCNKSSNIVYSTNDNLTVGNPFIKQKGEQIMNVKKKCDKIADNAIYYAELTVKCSEETEQLKRNGKLTEAKQSVTNMLEAYSYALALYDALKILEYSGDRMERIEELLKS